MEHPNQQDSIPMGGRTKYKVNHGLTQSGIDSVKKREKSKRFEH